MRRARELARSSDVGAAIDPALGMLEQSLADGAMIGWWSRACRGGRTSP
jgi:hypothetical protein